MRRSTEEERAVLAGVFADLCALPSPSGRERAVADHVTGLLRGLGLSVEEDAAGAELQGSAGNLLCRIPGASPGTTEQTATLLLCAHLDTVPVADEIRPEIRDGVWVDALGGVLGADNKATVAALLVLARRLVRRPGPVAVELLLTVQEEPQLRGITAFDVSRLRADVGFVVDHPSPVGGIVTAAPGHVRFEARFAGRAAHAGIRPEDGRSAVLAAARAAVALPHGRGPGGTTVNVGAIEGGAGAGPDGRPVTNVVPDRCTLTGEIRGPEEGALLAAVGVVEAALGDAAHDPASPVDLDLLLETRFALYRHAPSAPALVRATAAVAAVGLVPVPFADAGGSDANVLNARGLPTVNLAGGNERAHERGERIPVVALDQTLELVIALVEGEVGRD